jgi:hypothetical protein
VDSNSQLSLRRFQGAYIPLKIAGVWEAKLIPATAPVLANTGLTAATLYYIYAFDDAGTLTLEASTTAHATDADTGIEIKSGDASRTLVGKVWMDTGTPGTFVDSIVKRWCLNWFNRRGLNLLGVFTTSRNTDNNQFGEVNAEIRIQFLTWTDEAVWIGASGAYSVSGGQAESWAGIGITSTTVPSATSGGLSNSNSLRDMPFGMVACVTLASESLQYATILSANGGAHNPITFSSADGVGGTGTAKTRLYGMIRG